MHLGRAREYSRRVLQEPLAFCSRRVAWRKGVRITAVAGLAALTAGCGSATSVPVSAPRRPAVPPAPKRSHVVVTVVDGDTGRRVRGALVRVGDAGDYANRHGNAEFRLLHRRPLPVEVAARGYASREVRMPFQRRRRVVVRVYRPELQWPMYGATFARTQSHEGIHVRPPFRVVWSRGLGTLIEFPAVVSDSVAYIGNNHGRIQALSMRDGTRALADAAVRAHGLVAGGRRRRPRRPRDGRRRPRSRPPHRAPALGVPHRLADRVVADRPRPHRLLRRVERQRLRARPADSEAAVDVSRGREDHFERGSRRPARSTSATTAGGCSRSRPGTGRCAGRPG